MLSNIECNKPFVEHHQGFHITSDNLCLTGDITVETPKKTRGIEYSTEELMAAVAHFTAMHAILIHPDLPGFPGYGCLRFKLDDGEN